MVYCSKCGTKNEEFAETCMKCGSILNLPREKSLEKRIDEWGEDIGKRAETWGKSFGKQTEEGECFGLPHGGTIFGLIIGIIIIVVGISLLAGIDLEYAWPLILLIFGVLIIGGAIYTLIRKR